MDPLVTGSIIQEGSGLLSSVINNIWAQAQQAGQREHAYQMTDYLYSKDLQQWNRQNEFNLNMWNLANEYNSPSAQMGRFKDAGLNPNLIYGQGTPGLSSPVPMAPSPKAQGQAVNTARTEFNLPPLDFMDMLMKKQSISNMEQARLKLIEDTNIAQADAIIRAKEAGFKDEEIQYLKDSFQHNRNMWVGDEAANKLKEADVAASIAHKVANANLTNKQLESLQEDLDFYDIHGIRQEKLPWWMRIMFNWNPEDYERGFQNYESMGSSDKFYPGPVQYK